MKFRVIFVSVLLVAACAACAPIPKSPSSSGSTADSSKNTVSSSAESSKSDSTFEVGETFQLDDFEIKVDSFAFKDKIETSYYTAFKPDEGNIFAVVSLTVTNKGKDSATFLPTYAMGNNVRADILFGDGYEFSASNLLGYENDMHDSTLNPLTSKTGEIIFDIAGTIPDSTEPLVLKLDGKDVVNVKLR